MRRTQEVGKSLEVEIPIRFKAGLQRRFDLRRAKRVKLCLYNTVVDGFMIKEECPLCRVYATASPPIWPMKCEGCPFVEQGGCIRWARKVFPEVSLWGPNGEEHLFFMVNVNKIVWLANVDTLVRRQIRTLKRRARKLIRWV
ncbi:MAG: hypothetical protein J7L26_03450 [Candidatus Aminicenantes bacterium]|nr:hypothetical protein [Candidatus Aminicenantes bacterium]